MGVASVDATVHVSVHHPTLVPTVRDARAPTSAQRTVTSTLSVLSALSMSSSHTL